MVNNYHKKKYKAGFSLAELVVGIAVFSVIIISVYQSYTSIFNVNYASRAKLDAVNLANEELEIIRNMAYNDVGISGGIPDGVLTHQKTIIRGGSSFLVTTSVRNIDDPFDGTLGGTPNDTAPADFKLVEIEINCELCKNFSPMIVSTRVAPKNLENSSNNGALFIKVFDANGLPVVGSNVHIENNGIIPNIIIDDVTNISGMLQIVDVPPGVNTYEITVTKSGYSTDKTYSATVSNPFPTKPHSTVATQQLTQVSFVIDKLSTFSIASISSTCNAAPSVDFSLKGSKIIGTSPDVLKYSQNLVTDANGSLTLSNMEWDTYSFTNTDLDYDLIGINPLSPIVLSPGISQNVQYIVAPKNPKTLLVTIKDGATGLPLSDVSVTASSTSYKETKLTGQGVITQTSWAGGSGQATTTDMTMYYYSDGNVEVESPIGDVTLKKVLGEYVSSGVLVSSSFDTGASSNFHQIDWSPSSQPVGSNVRLQIATNNDGGTWNFTGPDGTAGTYYDITNKNIYAGNDGNRYFRYKLFLDTTSTSTAPNISDISFTFTSDCISPGQVSFQGLLTGSYQISISKTGYVGMDDSIDMSSDWQSVDFMMLSN